MKITPFVNVKTCLIIQSRLKPATFVSEVSSLTQWANEALPWHNWLKLLVYNTFHIFDCEGLVPFRGVFGDTKEIIRIRNSKKDRQHNVQKRKDRQHNVQKKKDRQHNVQKKDRQHNVQKKKDKPSCYYVYWPGDMSWMRIGPSCAYFLYSYHRISNLRV